MAFVAEGRATQGFSHWFEIRHNAQREEENPPAPSRSGAQERLKMPTPKREDAASSPAVTGAGAPLLGVPFSLPNGALMPLGNAQSTDADELSLGGAASDKQPRENGADPEQKTELTLQQQQLVHQQLQQQQLQLLQFQQQQLQNMSPSDLSAVAAMAHQMALGMVMMPMMPFMMPLNGAPAATTPSNGSSDQHASSSDAASSPTANGSSSAIGSESLELAQGGEGFGSQASPLTMMGGASFGLSGAGHDDTPKRKRGRPPKKDVVARAKVEAEKTLKQFPMWGYGVPMPLLPGFPGILPPNLTGSDQSALQTTSSQEDPQQQVAKDEDSDSGYDKTGRARTGKGPAKKKARGTGKPRGRPRTRPRPGEIIRRAKPPAIAPANYSVMYNYSLSNLAQKTAEMANDAANASSGAHDDNRLANLGVSLLSNEHE